MTDPHLADYDAAEDFLDADGRRRLGAYTYLTGQADTPSYVAIMRVFTRSLMTDFSATDVGAKLAEQGLVLDTDVVEQRLRNLVDWGNLLPSPREVRVTSIADYQRQRARYQLSKLGGQVHAQAEVILAATEGVQEVTRELLGIVARDLAALADLARSAAGIRGAAAEHVAELVTTVFVSFASFASQIREFYASLGNLLARFDLDGDEYDGFKTVLIDYIDVVIGDVDRYSPRIEASLTGVDAAVDDIVALLDDPRFAALRDASGTTGDAGRAPGRTRADWTDLQHWFDPNHPSAGVRELRAATSRALSALLANLKRLNAAAAADGSQRRDLLRLAAWFDRADTGAAHALYDAAFGMHGVRHFAGIPNNAEVPATTSWWTGPKVDVPVSLREHGDRTARGRHTPAADHSAQRARLAAERAAEAERRRAAAVELLAAGDRLDRVRISAAALGVLTELLTNALSQADPTTTEVTGTAPDTEVVCTLHRRPGVLTRIHSQIGDLTIHDALLSVAATSERSALASVGAPA
ncbi:MAG: TIGR02677 family protein [Vicinamibacterales bacterium]